jgi:desulfoferrodoxin-like iron-binding protein
MTRPSHLLAPVPERISITMTKVKEIYHCDICGNKVQVLEAGAGQLVCCGQPMKKVAK